MDLSNSNLYTAVIRQEGLIAKINELVKLLSGPSKIISKNIHDKNERKRELRQNYHKNQH